jgi:uncharacterized membrane protein
MSMGDNRKIGINCDKVCRPETKMEIFTSFSIFVSGLHTLSQYLLITFLLIFDWQSLVSDRVIVILTWVYRVVVSSLTRQKQIHSKMLYSLVFRILDNRQSPKSQ